MAPIVSKDYKVQKKKEILDSALKCFARKGFETTTVDEICSESGVSKGAIYTYFKSKDEIYLELMSQRTDDSFNLIREALADITTTMEKMDYLFSIYDKPFPFDKESVGELAVGAEFKIRSSRYEEINDILTKRRVGFFVKLLTEILEDGQKSGEVKNDKSPQIYAELFWAMLDGLLLQVVYKDYPFHQVLKAMKEMYLQSILK